jgi:hypothetical protein
MKKGLKWFNMRKKQHFLWTSYKERLGSSDFTCIHFDLNNLLQRMEGLKDLDRLINKEDIDSIIRDLPLEKSLGPDGFNIDFMKNVGVILEIILPFEE